MVQPWEGGRTARRMDATKSDATKYIISLTSRLINISEF